MDTIPYKYGMGLLSPWFHIHSGSARAGEAAATDSHQTWQHATVGAYAEVEGDADSAGRGGVALDTPKRSATTFHCGEAEMNGSAGAK
jgi:hypothetical protein